MNKRSNRTLWVLLGAVVLGFTAAMGQMVWKNRQAQTERDEAEARQKIEDEQRRAQEAAARIFGASQAASPEDRVTFDPLFASLGAALQSQKPDAVAALFDPERMATELDHHGFFARFGPEDSKKARDLFLSGFDRVGRLVVEDPLYRWNETGIRRVSRNADGSAALVVATHTLAGRPEPLHMRWWLAKTPQGWKVYDLENLLGGVRLSTILEAATDASELNKFEQSAIKVRAALAAAISGNPDIADQLLAQVRGQKIPDSLAARVSLTEALIRIHRGEPTGARPFLEQAAKLDPDLPTLQIAWAIARARTGEYPGAITAANAFAAQCGNDLGVCFWHGFALEEQGQASEAARFYSQALDEDPNLFVALIGLQRTTNDPGALATRLASTRQPGVAFALLKQVAEDAHLPFALAEPQAGREPVDAFAEALRFGRIEALYRNKQGLQAYQKIGPVEKTFDQLAGNYVSDKDAAGLAKLLAVHTDSFANDPWLEFWQGELASLRGENAKAAAYYRAFRRSPAASPADRHRAAVLQVRSLIRAGESAEAKGAVNEIGPERLPAGLRAAVLALAGDVEGLEVLLTAQAKSPHGLVPIYADEDFARLIASEPFEALRMKYPAPKK